MTRPKHLDHTLMFAPIFIGMFFGLAILGSMSIFMPSRLSVSNAMSEVELTFESCANMPGSMILEKYPPACVTSDGVMVEQSVSDYMYPEM